MDYFYFRRDKRSCLRHLQMAGRSDKMEYKDVEVGEEKLYLDGISGRIDSLFHVNALLWSVLSVRPPDAQRPVSFENSESEKCLILRCFAAFSYPGGLRSRHRFCASTNRRLTFALCIIL